MSKTVLGVQGYAVEMILVAEDSVGALTFYTQFDSNTLVQSECQPATRQQNLIVDERVD